jgi:predicted amidohydrolase
MKIALAQIAPALGEIALNVETHVRIARETRARGAELAVFPELSITGYDLLERAVEFALTPESSELLALLDVSRSIDLHFGFLERGVESPPFNSSAYLSLGVLRDVHQKVYLPTYGRFREAHYFSPGQRVRSFELKPADSHLARGSTSGRIRLGTIICEELWHPSVALLLTQDGAELLIVQTAGSVSLDATSSEFSDSLRRWQALAISTAIANRAFVLVVNRVGVENENRYFGNSFVVSPRGQIIAQGRAFEEDLLFVELDVDEIARARAEMPLVTDERCDLTIRELERIWRARQSG